MDRLKSGVRKPRNITQISRLLTKILSLFSQFCHLVEEISVTSHSNLHYRSTDFHSKFLTNILESWTPYLFKIVPCAAITVRSTIISINVDSDPFQFLLRSAEKLFCFPFTTSNLNENLTSNSKPKNK